MAYEAVEVRGTGGDCTTDRLRLVANAREMERHGILDLATNRNRLSDGVVFRARSPRLVP